MPQLCIINGSQITHLCKITSIAEEQVMYLINSLKLLMYWNPLVISLASFFPLHTLFIFKALYKAFIKINLADIPSLQFSFLIPLKNCALIHKYLSYRRPWNVFAQHSWKHGCCLWNMYVKERNPQHVFIFHTSMLSIFSNLWIHLQMKAIHLYCAYEKEVIIVLHTDDYYLWFWLS